MTKDGMQNFMVNGTHAALLDKLGSKMSFEKEKTGTCGEEADQ